MPKFDFDIHEHFKNIIKERIELFKNDARETANEYLRKNGINDDIEDLLKEICDTLEKNNIIK